MGPMDGAIYCQGRPICVGEWDKSINRGSKKSPLNSQLKPEEVTDSTLVWGPFWLLRLGHSSLLRRKSTRALSEKLVRIPSKPNLSQPVSNSAKALSYGLCIRPHVTYEGESVFHLCPCVYVCILMHAVIKYLSHCLQASLDNVCGTPKCLILNY